MFSTPNTGWKAPWGLAEDWAEWRECIRAAHYAVLKAQQYGIDAALPHRHTRPVRLALRILPKKTWPRAIAIAVFLVGWLSVALYVRDRVTGWDVRWTILCCV